MSIFIKIAIINRLFDHFIIILDSNFIIDEGVKALAEGLKLNEKLLYLDLSIFLISFYQNRKILAFLILRNNS